MSRVFLGVLALAVAFTVTGCDDGSGVDGPGSLTLLLTDDPGDFKEAVVEISQIELVGGGTEGEEGEAGGILPLMGEADPPFRTNLLTLANDAIVLVDGATVPSGTYSQLRFIIPSACIVVEGTETEGDLVYASPGLSEEFVADYPDCGAADGILQLPSYAQTGIKVNLPNEVLEVSEGEQALLLDFDVSETFGHDAGMSGKWVMSPVINATSMSLSRNITVELVNDPVIPVDLTGLGNTGTLADFAAVLDAGQPDQKKVAFQGPDDGGVFSASFMYLLPGQEYVFSVELNEGVTTFTFAVDPESQVVSLTSGQDETVLFTLKSASASSP